MSGEESFADKVFIADLQGIYAQHGSIQAAYGESLKILLAVGSLPVLAAAAFLAVTKEGIYLTRLPPFLSATTLITPVLVFFVLGIAISNRLTSIFYARILNAIRAMYLSELPATRRDMLRALPSNPGSPPYYEPGGPTGLVVHLTGFVCGLYCWLGLFNALRNVAPDSSTWVSVAAAVVVLVIFEFWYVHNCRKYGSFVTSVERDAAPAAVGRPLARELSANATGSAGLSPHNVANPAPSIASADPTQAAGPTREELELQAEPAVVPTGRATASAPAGASATVDETQPRKAPPEDDSSRGT